jgi:hypothetical protein
MVQYTCVDDVVRAQDWNSLPSAIKILKVNDISYTAFGIGHYGLYVHEFASKYRQSLEHILYGLAAGGHTSLFITYYHILDTRRDEDIEYYMSVGRDNDAEHIVSTDPINLSKARAIAIGNESFSIYNYLLEIDA